MRLCCRVQTLEDVPEECEKMIDMDLKIIFFSEIKYAERNPKNILVFQK